MYFCPLKKSVYTIYYKSNYTKDEKDFYSFNGINDGCYIICSSADPCRFC